MIDDNMDLESGGVKFDAGKVRLDLNPQDALLATAAVFTYGAIKYDDWNWTKGMRAGRILAALDRHKAAYLLGEEFDDESGMPHLWHIGCCALMAVAADLRGVLEDDRDRKSYGKDADADAWTDTDRSLAFFRKLFSDMKEPADTSMNDGDSVVDDEKFDYGPDLEEGGLIYNAACARHQDASATGFDMEAYRQQIATIFGIPADSIRIASYKERETKRVMSLTEAVDRKLVREGESVLYAGFNPDGSKHSLTTDPICDPWCHADSGLTPVNVIATPKADAAGFPIPLRFSVGNLGTWRGRANGYRCMVIV